MTSHASTDSPAASNSEYLRRQSTTRRTAGSRHRSRRRPLQEERPTIGLPRLDTAVFRDANGWLTAYAAPRTWLTVPLVSESHGSVGRLDELADSWTRRGNRVASSAWLYHLGLDAFCFGEHSLKHRRAGGVLGALLLRDAGIAAAVVRSKDAQRTAGLAAVASFVSDAFATSLLRKRLPKAAFITDRSLSQFGLGVGWAFQFALREGRSQRVTSHLAPVAMQALLAAYWQVGRRDGLAYVAREALWSTTALMCVRQLSRSLRDAVDDGRTAASTLAAMREAEAEMKAREWTIEQTSHSLINQSLREYKMWLQVIEGDTSSPLYQLAEAEAERLRGYPEPDTVTIATLALFIVNLRDPATEKATWHHEGDDPVRTYTLSRDLETTRELIREATQLTGPIEIRTRASSGAVRVEIRADDEIVTPPAGATTERTEEGTLLLETELKTQPSRYT